MKKALAAVAGIMLVGAAGITAAAPASAGHAYDPNIARVANPATACKSIIGSVENAAAIIGQDIDTSSFDFVDCVTTLAHGDAFVEPAELFGSPYEQCDRLVAMGFLTYPSTLHNGTDEEELLLPDLIVKNRKQCGSALYAYHAIVTYFEG